MASLFSPAPTSQSCLSPPPATPTTDGALIESQKENIRPLASGRSAATLSALFQKDVGGTAAAEKILAEGHERFRTMVEEAERRDREGEDMVDGVDDLLDAYNQHIVWAVQHNTSSNAYLLPLLESVTRRFTTDARYSQDIRYVKMWVQYTRHVERREEVWSFLESRNIGTNHAVFYEEWASACEGLGRKKRADEIFSIGIARNAQPLSRLKSRHAAFLQRILVTSSAAIPDDEPLPPAAGAHRTPARSILGQVSTAPMSVSGATQLAPANRLSKATNGMKMEVFSDDAGRKVEDGVPGEWADFGTRDGRRKENVVEATSWKGETMPVAGKVAPRTPKVEVFRDTSDNDAARPAPAEETLFKTRQMTEAELLKTDPLRHYDTSSVSTTVPSIPAPPSARKPPRPTKASSSFTPTPWSCPNDGPVVKDARGKTEKRMFDWNGVFKGGEEWSFEEVRARGRGLLGKEWKGEVKEWETRWHMPGSSTPKKEMKKKPLPSPTVNTKLANEEINAMFDQTIHGGKVRDSDDEDESDSDDDADMDAENAGPVQAAPTPLPPRQAPQMLLPGGGMVPPTPTPAQGYVTQNRPLPALIHDENAFGSENIVPPTPVPAARGIVFSDENAVPPSASKARFNVFSGTPAREPLVARTPLGSKPKPFGIFSDVVEEPEPASNAAAIPAQEPVSATPLNQMQPHRPAVFDTPAPAGASRRIQAFASAIPEEADEEDEQEAGGDNGEHRDLTNVVEFEQAIDINDVADEYDDELPKQKLKYFGAFNSMTPITERTLEFTQMTNLRSSQTGTQSSRYSIASGRRSSVRGISEAVEAGLDEEAEPVEPAVALSAVVEEDEQSSGSGRNSRLASAPMAEAQIRAMGQTQKRSDAPDHSSFLGDDDSSPRVTDGHSGSIRPDFALPEGFTIHRALRPEGDEVNTMVIVDAGGSTAPRPVEQDEIVANGTGAAVAVSMPLDVRRSSAPPSATSCLPNPCNPSDDDVLAVLLSTIDPPLSALSGFHDLRTTNSNQLSLLQKHTKPALRRSSSAPRSSAAAGAEEKYVLSLGERQFEMREKIGEGGFGAVFLASDLKIRQEQDDMDSDDEDDDDEELADKSLVAIKVEKPASIWEAVVLDRVRRRIQPHLVPSIIEAKDLFAFADESHLLLEFASQGTLLDIVNKASAIGIAPTHPGSSSFDEIIAIFFTIELLKMIEGLHTAGFIHGDLKIDNCLVRLDPIPSAEGGAKAWSGEYTRSGTDGWKYKGLKLIDFGRAIDLSLFPAGAGQRFTADWSVDEKDCVEMREGKEWSYETDYFGLAGICYCMLFGKYISTEEGVGPEGRGGRWFKIGQPLKRYWQSQLWTKLFDVLLNPHLSRPDGALPITDELSAIRSEFEDWLEVNCQKGGKDLKLLLKRIELAAITGSR